MNKQTTVTLGLLAGALSIFAMSRVNEEKEEIVTKEMIIKALKAKGFDTFVNKEYGLEFTNNLKGIVPSIYSVSMKDIKGKSLKQIVNDAVQYNKKCIEMSNLIRERHKIAMDEYKMKSKG